MARRAPLWIALAVFSASCVADNGGQPDSTAPPETSSTASPGSGVPTEPTPAPPSRRPGELEAIDGGSFVDLPDGVAAANEVLLWTGTELLFWGGEDESSSGVPAGEPGHAYNPESNTWRTISASPKSAAYGAAAVWTGEEALICCGARSVTMAAYDPARDSWRSLAEAPLSGEYAEAVWTGSEMLVITGGGVAAFDPSVGEWRTFQEPPKSLGRLNQIAWTGTELIVWPSEVERHVHQGMALDPNTGKWRVLLDPPAWPAALDMAWTGQDLIIWGGLPAHFVGSERAVGARLDLADNVWSELPEPLPEPDGCECNLGSQTLLWTGDRLLVSAGQFGTGVDPSDPLLLGYDPTTDGWSLLGVSPAGWGAAALMAGDRVVFLSDRLFVSEPGWAPTGSPIPRGGLTTIDLPTLVHVPGLTRVGAGGATFPAGPETTVVATNGQAAISLLDLRFGTRADYGGSHTAGADALDLTVTSLGDVIVWNTGPPKLYEHHDQDPGWALLHELTQPPRTLGSLEGSVYATDDGHHAWIWGFPGNLEYVETSTGDVVTTAEIPEGYQPLFTAGDNLVIRDDLQTAILHTTGVIDSYEANHVIEATADYLIWEDCDLACAIVLTPLTSTGVESRIDAPPGAERWTRAGAVIIPSSSPNLPTISPQGLLLIDAVSGSDPDATHRLTIIDLGSGEATVVKEYEGPLWASAFWDRSGLWIVVASNTSNGQDISIIDASSFEETRIANALPDEYWILGAG